jgi:RecB family endonuclease NucS
MARLFTIKESKNLEELEPKSYSTTHPLIGEKGERFLQELIADNPEKLIPWEQIVAEEDEEAQVIVIKTEAGVTKGSIDVLLLGNDGVLTIVEAKLSENTREIRRMMIAQAIEYAAQLYSEWNSNRIQNEGFFGGNE